MPLLEFKPLDWFRVEPQVRKQFDQSELQQLGESLAVRQLQPVLARPDGILLAGERRYRAAKLVGLAGLLTVISDEPLSDSEMRVVQLTENLHRASLTAHEQWQACQELLALNPSWRGKELGEHLKLSAATITRLLSPSACIAPAQQALAAGRIGITDCYALSRLPADAQDEVLALMLSKEARSTIERRIRQCHQVSPAVRTGRVKCSLPSGVSIVVTGEALSLDDLIDALAEAQREARRAREQSLDVRTFAAVLRDKSQKSN
jgi:ParB family transcriptional regulator, chromosome partitioning protein